MSGHIATGSISEALQAEAGGHTALCAAMPITGEGAPDWLHLLPLGPTLETYDKRGPYRLTDMAAVVTASLQASAERGAVIDENHATDIAAPQGLPAPARGWITDYEARADGIWGKVEWNEAGRALVADRAYRGISPVILTDKDKTVLAITRASLINRPNLKGLTALHQESDMDLLATLTEKLGLATGTAEGAVVAAVEALQGQLGPIAKAAGLGDDATAEAVLGAIGKLKAPAGGIEALQAELKTVTEAFNGLKETLAREKATSFVDGAIGEKRVGVAALREHYIAMHMEDPARVEKEIGAMPKLGASHTGRTPPRDQGGGEGLTEADGQMIALFGIAPEDFRKTRAAEGHAESQA